MKVRRVSHQSHILVKYLAVFIADNPIVDLSSAEINALTKKAGEGGFEFLAR